MKSNAPKSKTTCEVRSELCNGEELRRVWLRIPMTVNRWEPEPKLSCHGCRTFHWGAFRNAKAGEWSQPPLPNAA